MDLQSAWAGFALRARRRTARLVKSSQVAARAQAAWRAAGVKRNSRFDNVYYCCVQKTASQWIRAVLEDPIVHRWCGLDVLPFRELGLTRVGALGPFPPRTIVAHLYISYPAYAQIPKPTTFRTFYVSRDPRDAVVSWYFSARYSHKLVEPIPELRPHLEALGQEDGLLYLIDRLAGWSYFAAQQSWLTEGASDPAVRILAYEQLAERPAAFLGELFDHLEFPVPARDVGTLLARHSFAAHAGGRVRGEEDLHSHYRKGTPGDWKTYFTPRVEAHLAEVTGASPVPEAASRSAEEPAV